MNLPTHHSSLILKQFVIAAPHGNRKMLGDIRYQPDGQAKPVVVFVHGFKGFKDWGGWDLMMDEIALAGFVVMKANLSHNGTTPEAPLDFADLEAFGHNNYSIELDDVGAWLDALETGTTGIDAQEIDLQRLGIIGHSRGGAIVVLKAAEDPRIKAIVAWAPVADLSKRYSQETIDHWEKEGVHYIPNSRTGQQMPMYFQLIEDFRNNRERLDVPARVKGLTQPLLVVHGDADPTVPPQDGIQLKEWHPQGSVLLIAGGDHVFGMRHPRKTDELPPEAMQVASETAPWLADCL